MASISAQADLAQFIVECLLRLDPTLNTAEGGRVYTTVVNPLLRRLGTDPLAVDVETFIQQRMLDVFPDLDVTTPGSALRDILVAPLVMLLTPLRTEIAHLRRQQSLADYETLSEEELDALLANVLASRDTGSFSYGSARVFFPSARVVGIDASIVFQTPTGTKYLADEVRTYLPSEMTRQGNQWYLDIPIRSGLPNSSANIPANTQLIVTGIDGVVRCYNPKAISGGITKATNADFYARAQEALTERSLNTERGINRFISENTTGVVSVDVVGFGDPLMERDVLTAAAPITVTNIPGGVPFPGITGTSLTINANQVHIGGATDIYVKTGQPVADVLADVSINNDFLQETDVWECVITGGGTTVTSTGLGTAVGYAGSPVTVNDIVLEFENFVGITPVAVRVVAATSADTVRIETAFSGFAGALANQRARLLSVSIVDLVYPKSILQAETLTTFSSSKTVKLDGAAVKFNNDPTTEAIYLEITFYGRPVEYRVVAKAADELTLDRVPEYVGSGFAYRAYLKQSGNVQLPLLQVTRMFLADGDTGIELPYRSPVHTTVLSAGGKRSAPLTYLDLGQCAVAGDQFTCSGYSFIDAGIQAGDLLYDPAQPAGYRHYVVASVDSATAITLTSPAPEPQPTTVYRIGSPTYSSATLTFMDPTYVEVTEAGTRLSYTDDEGVEHQFKPSQSEYGYLYNPTELTTGFALDGTDPALITCTEDLLAIGARVGDKLEVQAVVLVSTVFTDADELLLAMDGTSLIATVDGTNRIVNFPVTGDTWSIDDVATQINQQIGTDLLVERYHASADNNFIRFYSRKHIVLSDYVGAPLVAMQMSDLDNYFTGIPSSYGIASIAAAGTSAALSGAMDVSVKGNMLLVAIKRQGSQFIFPANMTQLANGLYAAAINVEATTPYDAGKIPTNAEFILTSYRSMGHVFAVANNAYSFSTGERLHAVITPLVLPPTATSMLEALTTPLALLTVEYEHAPEVSDLQTAFLRPNLRVTCNSPLVRHHLPAYPVIGINYVGLSGVDDIEAALLKFFVRLYPNSPLEAYDVLTELGKLEVSDVEGPVEVGYLTIDKDRVIKLSKSLDRVELERSFHVMGEIDYVSINKR